MNNDHTPRYFEDIAVGDRFRTAEELVTAESMIAYAKSYDPQPMHTDPDADSPFGTLVASGWHTLSLTMRLMVEARPFGSTPLIGMGIDEIRLPRPVLAGMRLHAEAEVLAVRASKRQGRGYVRMEVRTVNREGVEVARQVWSMVLPSSEQTKEAWRL